jgi:hypothetical protein
MAAESIGAIYSTKIPGYADNADIQAAFTDHLNTIVQKQM